MDLKKINKALVVTLLVLFVVGLSACDTTYTQEELDEKLAQVDLATDNEAAINDAIDNAVANGELLVPETESGELDEVIDFAAVPEETEKRDEITNTLDDISPCVVVTESYDDSDLSYLQDTEVEIDDEDYNVRETLSYDNVKVAYSSCDDEKLEGKAALFFERESFVATLQFKSKPNWDEVSEDNPMRVNFLGKELEIVKVNEAANSFKVRIGKKYTLDAGNIGKYGDVEIIMMSTYNGGARFLVDGEKLNVDEGDTEKVKGLKIYVEEVGNDDGIEWDFAEVSVGKDDFETIENGDEYLNEDEDAPEWVFDIDFGAAKPYIAVTNNFKVDKAGSDYLVELDGCVRYPENYAKVCFLQDNTVDESDLDSTFEDEMLGGVEKVTLLLNGKFEVDGGSKLDKLYTVDGKFYEKDNNELVEVAQPELRENGIELSWNGDKLVIGDVQFKVDFATESILKVKLDGVDVSGEDKNLRTKFGFVVEDPENIVEDNEIKLTNIPDEEVQYKLTTTMF